MKQSPNVFLIGGMGAGKTTIGRKLAAALHYQFYDIDKEIEFITGVDIAWIFEIEGESGFRARETAMLHKLCTQTGKVIATGGGSVLSLTNRELLKNNGTVVYLKTTIEHQLLRLYRDKQRPLLQVPDKELRLRELMLGREILYQETADLIVETDSRPINNVVQLILTKLRE